MSKSNHKEDVVFDSKTRAWVFVQGMKTQKIFELLGGNEEPKRRQPKKSIVRMSAFDYLEQVA